MFVLRCSALILLTLALAGPLAFAGPGEDELSSYLEAVERVPQRDDPALLEWRRRESLLPQRLSQLCQDGQRSLSARAGALRVLAALGEQSAQVPAVQALPAELRDLAARARTRIQARATLLAALSLERAPQRLLGDLPAGPRAELLELLCDPWWGVPPELRLRAVRVASALSGALATAALRARTRDADEAVQRAALDGLAERGASAALRDELPGLLAAGNPAGAARALEHLSQAEGSPPVDLCRRLLSDDALGDEARAVLAQALGRLGWRQTAGALKRLARDQRRSRRARCAAWAALAVAGEPVEVEGVRSLLEGALDDDLRLASVALEGLARVQTKELTPLLRQVLAQADRSGLRRVRLAQLCEALRLDVLERELCELALDAEQLAGARQAAIHALGRVGSTEAERALSALSRDPERAGPALRREAVDALGERAFARASEGARLALERALRDNETTVRRAALRCLIRLGDRRSAHSLTEALAAVKIRRTGEARLWLRAATALHLSEPAATGRLLSLWRSSEALREEASLGGQSARYAATLPAKQAVPELLELLAHPAPSVAQAALVELVRRCPKGAEWSPELGQDRRPGAACLRAWRAAWEREAAAFGP
ncbi:MAG TPA: hypothetical protein DEA08_10010 [Planctomycetes bacterium]|nr:hypothetical protein [Planctomycetota bacterium]